MPMRPAAVLSHVIRRYPRRDGGRSSNSAGGDIDTRWLWHITLGTICGERYADDGAAGSLRTCGEIMMRMIQLLAGALALVTGVLAAEVSAAELKVLSAGAMRAVLQELAPAFETASW